MHNCNCYINYEKLVKYAEKTGKEIPRKKEAYKLVIEKALEKVCENKKREDIRAEFSFISEKGELANYIYSFVNNETEKTKEYYFIKIIKLISMEFDKKTTLKNMP